MNPETAQEIIACLPQGRTLFFYFKDRYALMLLRWYIGERISIRELKQSPYAKLLNRPLLKELVKQHGDGYLRAADLESAWPSDPHCYLLTLGTWGKEKEWRSGWSQTSRPGTNLVLQLNFSNQHNAKYQNLIDRNKRPRFGYSGHPVAREGFLTLAWARIDIDFETNEALIEEIQSDWIAEASHGHKLLNSYGAAHREEALERFAQWMAIDELPTQNVGTYLEKVIAPHLPIWQEAMLAATIEFLTQEIGIRYVFFHTYETGRRMKRIPKETPPRSIYTQLPKAFCLQPTAYGPDFLVRHSHKSVRAFAKREDAVFFIYDHAETAN